MSLAELLYNLAYIVFTIGAALCYLEQGSRRSVIVLSVGAGLDFAVTLAPVLGIGALSMNVQGTNAVITAAAVGGVAVWSLFVAALLLRWRGRIAAFQWSVLAVQVIWFVDFIGFLYGMYVYPLS